MNWTCFCYRKSTLLLLLNSTLAYLFAALISQVTYSKVIVTNPQSKVNWTANKHLNFLTWQDIYCLAMWSQKRFRWLNDNNIIPAFLWVGWQTTTAMVKTSLKRMCIWLYKLESPSKKNFKTDHNNKYSS